MWDYVPTRFCFAGDVDTRRAFDLLTDGYDRVDPSPRDHQFNTCAKNHLSDCDRSAYLTPRGDAKSVGLSSKGDRAIAIWRPPLKPRGTLICVGSSSSNDQNRMALRMRGRTPRSWLDRAAIAARSSRDRTSYAVESPLLDPTRIGEDLRPRSKPDRDPIVARSWSNRGAKIVEIGGLSTVKSGQNWRGFEATKPCKGNRFHEAWKPPPRPPLQPTIPGQFLL